MQGLIRIEWYSGASDDLDILASDSPDWRNNAVSIEDAHELIDKLQSFYKLKEKHWKEEAEALLDDNSDDDD